MPAKKSAPLSPFMESLKVKLLARRVGGRTTSQSTADKNIGILRNLNGGNFDNLNWLDDTPLIMYRINEYADNTQRSHLSVILTALETDGKSSNEFIKQFEYRKHLMLNVNAEVPAELPSPEEPAPSVRVRKSYNKCEITKTWEEIQAIQKKEFPTKLEKVLASLWVLLPPRRAQDYFPMFVNGEDKETNRFDIEAKKFIFAKYKTAKIYGEQEVEVPDELHRILLDYLDGRTSGVLIQHGNGMEMSPSVLVLRMYNIFGAGITASSLRHIFDRYKYGAMRDDALETARLMGHSVGTAIQHYAKPAKIILDL